jgi:hypothetical protein
MHFQFFPLCMSLEISGFSDWWVNPVDMQVLLAGKTTPQQAAALPKTTSSHC